MIGTSREDTGERREERGKRKGNGKVKSLNGSWVLPHGLYY